MNLNLVNKRPRRTKPKYAFLAPQTTDDRVWNKDRKNRNKLKSQKSINKIIEKYGSNNVARPETHETTKAKYYSVPERKPFVSPIKQSH